MYIKCAHFAFAGCPLNCFSRLYPSSKMTSKIDIMMSILVLLGLYTKIYCQCWKSDLCYVHRFSTLPVKFRTYVF